MLYSPTFRHLKHCIKVEKDTPFTSIKLVVARDTPLHICSADVRQGYTLHVHTAYDEDGYTMHVHSDNGVDGYTLQSMQQAGGKGYTLQVYTTSGAWRGRHTAHPHCIQWKGIHHHAHTAGGGKENILMSTLLTLDRDTTSRAHCLR
jgi:hypothetical protein